MSVVKALCAHGIFGGEPTLCMRKNGATLQIGHALPEWTSERSMCTEANTSNLLHKQHLFSTHAWHNFCTFRGITSAHWVGLKHMCHNVQESNRKLSSERVTLVNILLHFGSIAGTKQVNFIELICYIKS